MLDEYQLYLKDNNIKYDKDLYTESKKNVEYVLLAVLVVGFLGYLNKQRIDQKNFSYFKFIFGTTKCSKIYKLK